MIENIIRQFVDVFSVSLGIMEDFSFLQIVYRNMNYYMGGMRLNSEVSNARPRKLPLSDLYSFLNTKGESVLIREIKTQDVDLSTSRRGFAVIRLQEEGLYDEFMAFLEVRYPGQKWMAKTALKKYEKYISIPEADYVDLHFEGQSRFTMAQIKKMKFYVYEIVDPGTDKPFYIGKGRANRAFYHVKQALKGDPSVKAHRIREILEQGKSPILNIVKDGLTEAEAYQLESRLIAEHGLENLTNVQGGQSGPSVPPGE